MNSRILLAVLSALLVVAVYFRFLHEPVDWGSEYVPSRGADDWLKRREGLLSLTALGLEFPSDITMDGWRAMGTMTAVEEICFRADAQGRQQLMRHREGLAELRGLPQLVKLSFLRVHVDESCAAELSRFPRLERLWFYDSSIQDAHLAQLARIDTLESLAIHLGSVSGEGLAALGRLPRLRSLQLHGNPIADVGLVNLPPMECLWFLDLSHTNLSDESIKHLSQFESLRQLTLPDGVSEAGLASLREALPRCEIY